MANIQNQINAIKEKEYGEEIRGSIVDALLAVNAESADAKEATEQLLPSIDSAKLAAQAATEAAKAAQEAAEEVAGTDVGQLTQKFKDYVPITRTINDKALSSNVTLTAANVNAVPTSRRINNKTLTDNVTLTMGDLNAEPWKSAKTTADNSWTIRYQKSGYCRVKIEVYKTLQAADTPLSNQVVCYVPAALKPVNTQYLTVRAVNGSALIDMGTAELRTDNGLYMFCKQSSTAAEYIAYGEILLAQDLGDES